MSKAMTLNNRFLRVASPACSARRLRLRPESLGRLLFLETQTQTMQTKTMQTLQTRRAASRG